MRFSHWVVVLFCVSALQLIAQDSAPKPKTVAIKAAHLVDVRAGRALNQQVVLVTGDRIEKVGPAG